MFNLLIKYLIFIIIGYLSGSIMFGYLIPKIMKNIDVRLVSSVKILVQLMLLLMVV